MNLTGVTAASCHTQGYRGQSGGQAMPCLVYTVQCTAVLSTVQPCHARPISVRAIGSKNHPQISRQRSLTSLPPGQKDRMDFLTCHHVDRTKKIYHPKNLHTYQPTFSSTSLRKHLQGVILAILKVEYLPHKYHCESWIRILNWDKNKFHLKEKYKQ